MVDIFVGVTALQLCDVPFTHRQPRPYGQMLAVYLCCCHTRIRKAWESVVSLTHPCLGPSTGILRSEQLPGMSKICLIFEGLEASAWAVSAPYRHQASSYNRCVS